MPKRTSFFGRGTVINNFDGVQLTDDPTSEVAAFSAATAEERDAEQEGRLQPRGTLSKTVALPYSIQNEDKGYTLIAEGVGSMT
ncbi:MAG: hypothetical protein AAFQ53_16595, partial [Bacteroidota bacterium]